MFWNGFLLMSVALRTSSEIASRSCKSLNLETCHCQVIKTSECHPDVIAMIPSRSLTSGVFHQATFCLYNFSILDRQPPEQIIHSVVGTGQVYPFLANSSAKLSLRVAPSFTVDCSYKYFLDGG